MTFNLKGTSNVCQQTLKIVLQPANQIGTANFITSSAISSGSERDKYW